MVWVRGLQPIVAKADAHPRGMQVAILELLRGRGLVQELLHGTADQDLKLLLGALLPQELQLGRHPEIEHLHGATEMVEERPHDEKIQRRRPVLHPGMILQRSLHLVSGMHLLPARSRQRHRLILPPISIQATTPRLPLEYRVPRHLVFREHIMLALLGQMPLAHPATHQQVLSHSFGMPVAFIA